jgi:hypothetical protein
VRLLTDLFLVAGCAHAGAVYDVTHRNSADATIAPTVTRYFVQGDSVRVVAPDANTVFIFMDQTIYVIDNPSRSFQFVTKEATLAKIADEMSEQVRKAEELASNAPPEQRAMAEKAAAMVKEFSDNQRRPADRDYQMTARLLTRITTLP